MTRIDIVYLWVNGADPVWRNKRRLRRAALGTTLSNSLAAYGDVNGRYRDNGELRYSLRALTKFFPDHGRIYIVTDRQVPAWLADHPLVRIVDHSEIIPAEQLPIFDSANIESYIHRIDGLSEQFFYLNDDVFFGAPVDSAQWFGTQPTFAIEANTSADLDDMQADALAPLNGAVLAKQWMRAHFQDYRHDLRLFAHAPKPLLRSALYALEQWAAPCFDKVRATTFRTWDAPSVITELLPRWMIFNDQARAEVKPSLYICTGDDNAEGAFGSLSERFGIVPFFCLNDTCDDAQADDPRLLRITETLQWLLPEPSVFERMYRRRKFATTSVELALAS